MTVAELIDVLSKVENKDLPIAVYDVDSGYLHDFDIDTDLTDRVDLNISTDQEVERE